MVNVVNVRKVIESIKDENNFFSMADFFVDGRALSEEMSLKLLGAVPPTCYTPACICGWAEYHYKKENNIDIFEDIATYYSADWLGISRPINGKAAQSTELFYPEHKPYNQISRQEAIDVLENLIITGEVNWNITNKGEFE